MKKFLCLFCAIISAVSLFAVGCSDNTATRKAPEPQVVTEEQPSDKEAPEGNENDPCPDGNDCDKEPCPDKDGKKVKPNFKFRPRSGIGKRKGDEAPEPPKPPVPAPHD